MLKTKTMDKTLNSIDLTLNINTYKYVVEYNKNIFFNLYSIKEHLKNNNIKKILLIIDKKAVSDSKLKSELHNALKDIDIFTFENFSSHPQKNEALEAAKIASRQNIDYIVAIGGGSCLDIGKIATQGFNSNNDSELEKLLPSNTAGIPWMAIPTTSGTGSEATHFAAIYDNGRKYSIVLPNSLPDAVVLDYRLHMSMPKQLAAVTGLDALSQAMESMWAVDSSNESMAYALEAGTIISENLEKSALHSDSNSRFLMMIGAHLAGKAINISKTTASHALSYHLSQKHGLSHGHAAALTLGQICAANARANESNCIDSRGVLHVRRQVDAAAAILKSSPDKLVHKIYNILNSLGLSASLKEAGLTHNDILDLAESADPERMSNNPVRVDKKEIFAILS